MLYNLFRYFLWVMYISFFRRVYYINSKAIPKKAPLIFASNHSNGFMDPILIAALQWRPVWFWARSSEFPPNLKGWMMRQLHGLPIYRKEEGVENMHKNEETFRISRELMYNGDTVFIAPEGNCVLQKRMLPFKTGCARLAFKMMEEKNWGIDTQIMPTGVNYTYHDRFRSEVYVRFGEPIIVNDYKDLYLEDSYEAVKQLTADLRKAMIKQMVYINKEEDDALVEKLLVLVRNNFKRDTFPIYSGANFMFEAEQQTANYVNDLEEEEKKEVVQHVDDYYHTLKKNGLNDFAVAGKNKRNFFWLFIGAPFWVLGTAAGRIPHIIARDLRNKFVPFREFSTSFAFTAAFFVWILWSVLIAIVAAFFIGIWALLLPVVMVALQTFAYHYEDYWDEWWWIRSYSQFKNKEEVEAERAAIFDKIFVG